MSDGKTETWKSVVGYEGYYDVSDLGNVRSVDRFIKFFSRWGSRMGRFHEGVSLKSQPGNFNYPTVSLNMGGRKKTHRVHSLVLAAFVGPRPRGMGCRHLDGDPQNSVLENLLWGTQKENTQDTVRHGRSARGEKNPMSKLKTWQVRLIKKSLELENFSKKDLANIYGVHLATIGYMSRGDTWSWV